MESIVNNLLNSFNNIPESGYSSKKLSAFAIMACVIVAHIKWIILADFSIMVSVLGADYLFIATMFGINEYGKKLNKEESGIKE